ncbi:hypothetical protein WN48_09525 [Eufriesea mexicana]|nr:hypothetical protein WN48_09525 [Eufriesea mexicana]
MKLLVSTRGPCWAVAGQDRHFASQPHGVELNHPCGLTVDGTSPSASMCPSPSRVRLRQRTAPSRSEDALIRGGHPGTRCMTRLTVTGNECRRRVRLIKRYPRERRKLSKVEQFHDLDMKINSIPEVLEPSLVLPQRDPLHREMLDRNVVLVLRTRQDRTERRLRHKREANPPPMEPPPQLLHNNYLYVDLNMNFSENPKQQAAKTKKRLIKRYPRERRKLSKVEQFHDLDMKINSIPEVLEPSLVLPQRDPLHREMLDRNVVLVLRTRQDRTERRLRHKREANPPPMEPPPQLLHNNYLYVDLNMNFSENPKQQAAKTKKDKNNLLVSSNHSCTPISILLMKINKNPENSIIPPEKPTNAHRYTKKRSSNVMPNLPPKPNVLQVPRSVQPEPAAPLRLPHNP